MRFDLSPTLFFRNIFELSPMINNDEVVVYASKPLSADDVKGVFTGMFDSPRVVVSRPIYEFEKDLVSSKIVRVPLEDGAVPLTHFLDSFYKTMESIKFLSQMKKNTGEALSPREKLSKFLSFDIGNQYYDCMSGGASREQIYIWKLFLDLDYIDLDEQVYPKSSREGGENSWYTLRDCIVEFSKCDVDKDVEDAMNMIVNKYMKTLLMIESS